MKALQKNYLLESKIFFTLLLSIYFESGLAYRIALKAK